MPVAELSVSDPFGPLAASLPLRMGRTEVSSLGRVGLLLLQPYRAKREAVAHLLETDFGLTLPPAGMSVRARNGESRILWFGREQWCLTAPPDAPILTELAERAAGSAALGDISHGWAGLRLTGAAAPDVLARAVALDLRFERFPEGGALRCELRHVAVALCRTGTQTYELLAPRSFCQSVAEELMQAMRLVAGREC